MARKVDALESFPESIGRIWAERPDDNLKSIAGRREGYELATSALRTSHGRDRIWLGPNGVGSARRRNRSDTETPLFVRVPA